MEKSMEKHDKNDLIMDKNIILYGPPGTGKTYNSIKYAVAIIEKNLYQLFKLNPMIQFLDVIKIITLTIILLL